MGQKRARQRGLTEKAIQFPLCATQAALSNGLLRGSVKLHAAAIFAAFLLAFGLVLLFAAFRRIAQ